MTKSAEKSLDESLETSPSSPCWNFFDSFTAPGIRPVRKERPDLTLYADLSRSLERVTMFLHEMRPASETLSCFAGISSIIRDCRAHWRRSCDSFAPSATTPNMITADLHSQEDLRSHLQTVRDYGASITIGLVMNAIVRMYFPDQERALAQTSWNFTNELITLAKQATQFKPLGAAFMSPFLHTLWAIGDRDSQIALTSALQQHQIDFNPKHATILSVRLNSLLKNMRSQILAQSSRTTSSSTTPLPESLHEWHESPEAQRAGHTTNPANPDVCKSTGRVHFQAAYNSRLSFIEVETSSG